MTLTGTEQQYLSTQDHGHLATVGPDGTPQVKPTGFQYNPELGTIDIYGFNMAQSAKYRNILKNPKVAFVVDDAPSQGPEGVRFLEVRGTAEAATGTAPYGESIAPEMIRIHPGRILSYNIDPPRAGLQTRDIDA